MSENKRQASENRTSEELARETFLKLYSTTPPILTDSEELLSFETKATLREKIAGKILCRFFIPIGRGRRQVGQCLCPISRDKFFFKPSKVKGELGEYHIRPELCDVTPKILPRQWSKYEAHFWLNNPNQIDYSDKGRDLIADAREIANSHHRFVQKNLLEQDMYLYIVLAIVAMVVAMIGLGYGFTKTPEQTEILTMQDGTQYVYQNGKLVAQGKGITALPAPIQAQIDAQRAAEAGDK